MADETLPRVFDISSQTKQKLRRERRTKIIKLSLRIPNLLHGYFLCFNLMDWRKIQNVVTSRSYLAQRYEQSVSYKPCEYEIKFPGLLKMLNFA